MRTTLLVGLAVVLLAGGTILGGWWALPVVGFAWGVVIRGRHPGMLAALAGAVAWGGLLVVAAIQTGTADVASITGGVLGVPAPAVYALAVGFAALLTGAAAAVGRLLRMLIRPARAGSASA